MTLDTRPQLDEPLGWAEAAAAIGWKHDPKGRKLKAMVLDRERETNTLIAIRGKHAKRGAPKLKVTVGALVRAFPELQQSQVQQIGNALRPYVEAHETHIRDIVREEVARSGR